MMIIIFWEMIIITLILVQKLGGMMRCRYNSFYEYDKKFFHSDALSPVWSCSCFQNIKISEKKAYFWMSREKVVTWIFYLRLLNKVKKEFSLVKEVWSYSMETKSVKTKTLPCNDGKLIPSTCQQQQAEQFLRYSVFNRRHSNKSLEFHVHC
jgi:hypothetical protein